MNINKILEQTNKTGQTIFGVVSTSSEKITDFFLSRNIRINTVDSRFQTPGFHFKKHTKILMEKGLNPKIINHAGYSRLYHLNHASFDSETLKNVADNMRNAIYYSFEDQKCHASCLNGCKANSTAFYFKNGTFMQRSEKIKIGAGSFGIVYRGI